MYVDLNELQALSLEKGTHVVSSGALATTSGEKTGRSPKDKRVVREPEFEDDVWWGKYSPNYMMDDRWVCHGLFNLSFNSCTRRMFLDA